jgi:replication factor C subunit 1
MALLSSTVSYGDMKARLVASAKDEDITAFSAVDKLLGYDSGRLSVNSRLDLAMQDADLEPLIVQVRSSCCWPTSVLVLQARFAVRG